MLTTCLALITIAGALCIARREVAKFKADAAAAAAGGATEGEVLPLASSGAAPAAEDTVAPNAEPAKKTAHPSGQHPPRRPSGLISGYVSPSVISIRRRRVAEFNPNCF